MSQSSMDDAKNGSPERKRIPVGVVLLMAAAAAFLIAVVIVFVVPDATSSSAPFSIDSEEFRHRDIRKPAKVFVADAGISKQGEASPLPLPVTLGEAGGGAPETEDALDPEMAALERELEASRAIAPVPNTVQLTVPTVPVPLALQDLQPQTDRTPSFSSPHDADAAPVGAVSVLSDPLHWIPEGHLQDAPLRKWLERWENGAELVGSDPARLRALEGIVKGSSLGSEALQAIGQNVGFVEGDQAAAIFYRLAVARAEQELAPSANPPNAAAHRSTLKALWAMSDPLMEKVRDYATSERLFRLLAAAEPAGSDSARRAAQLCAQAIESQGSGRASAKSAASRTPAESR